MTVIRRVNTKGLVERPNGSALNWYTQPFNVNLRYLQTDDVSGYANRQIQRKRPIVELNGIFHFSLCLHFECLCVDKMVEHREVYDQPEFPVLLGNEENSGIISGTFRNYFLHCPLREKTGDYFFQLRLRGCWKKTADLLRLPDLPCH